MQRVKILAEHWPNAVMLAAFLVGLVVVVSGPWWLFALIPLGIAGQMWNEYSLHRYVFHLPPPRRQWAFDLLCKAHYGHHDFPTLKGLFFVPWFVSLPILAVHFLIVSTLAGLIAPQYGWQIGAAITLTGGVGTFLCYEWFHMTAHLTVPKTAVERHVTTLHNQHHFRDFSRWFHVSPGGEVIDRLMGTAISRDELKSRQRAEFIRTLGMRPDDPRLISARSRIAASLGATQDEIARAARS